MEPLRPEDFKQGAEGSRPTSGPTKLEAVKAFLNNNAREDMKSWWTPEMETQVLIKHNDQHEVITKTTKQGRTYKIRRDENGIEYNSFRVPFNAGGEAHYTDSAIGWELDKYADGIGGTGWHWKDKVSHDVGYDFDAIMGHSENHRATLSADQLETVKKKAMEIDWIEVRRSTSGSGLHLYVHKDNEETNNHSEHAALARAILQKM